MLRRARAGSRPRPDVELACGSRSTSRVGWPTSAMAAARLMAVVVLPTPPFWLTTAMIGGAMVANMLGLASLADPTSGAIGGILAMGWKGWPLRLLRLPQCGGAAAAGPDGVGGDGDQPHLGGDGRVHYRAGYADANQQVVADLAGALPGEVRVLAEEPQPHRDHEHRRGVERKGVLRVDGGEQQRRGHEADAWLQCAPKENLLAEPWNQRQGHGPGPPA